MGLCSQRGNCTGQKHGCKCHCFYSGTLQRSPGRSVQEPNSRKTPHTSVLCNQEHTGSGRRTDHMLSCWRTHIACYTSGPTVLAHTLHTHFIQISWIYNGVFTRIFVGSKAYLLPSTFVPYQGWINLCQCRHTDSK